MAIPSLTLPVSLSGEGTEVEVGIRPEHVRLDSTGDSFRLDLIEKLGGVSYAYLESEAGERLIVEESGDAKFEDGMRVGISFDAERAMVFDKAEGRRIR